jgi:hypothetical protein
MQVKLIVEAGANPGRTFVLEEGQSFHIGRDRTNEYALPRNTNISRVHCRIENKAGAVSATDLDSKNGTLVNGVRISSRALRDSDIVEVGRVRLRVSIESPEGTPKAATEGEPIIATPRFVQRAPAGVRPALGGETESAVFPNYALDLVGKVVDKYQIMSAVSASRRGVVYKAIEPSKNRLVAIKVLSNEMAESPEGVGWFVEGAKVAGGLKHEDLVPVLGGGRLGTGYYLVSLFMARGSAQARFRRAPKEGIELVKFALQTAIHMTRALEFGLQQTILHRGVRPTKILFDENQRPRLSGLGFDNGPGPGFDMNSLAAAYLAPEQLRDRAAADVTADIYGLGGCFHYMLTGGAPQRGKKGEVQSPRYINRVVPESLCRILEKMLEQNPKKRYDSYGLLLHDLRWALRGEIWPRG